MRPQSDEEKKAEEALMHAGRAIAHAIVYLGADEEDVLDRVQKDIEWAVDERDAGREIG
jgi:hypothetical protein